MDNKVDYSSFAGDSDDFDGKTLSDRFVKKTRKPWRCDICGKIIPAGGPKYEQYNIDGHDFWTFRWCTVNCLAKESNVQDEY